MARAGVVDRDPARRLQPGPQHVARLVAEQVLPRDQQPDEMALGHVDADRPDLVQEARHRHLALVILRQQEAVQRGTEVTRHNERQGCRHGLAVRRHPALSTVAQGVDPQHEVLHHEIRVAFEARPCRHGGLDDALLMDGPALRLRTAATRGLGRIGDGTARLLHTARRHVRLDVRPPLQPLEPGDLIPLLGYDAVQSRHPFEKVDHQSFQLRWGQRLDVGRVPHASRESDRPANA